MEGEAYIIMRALVNAYHVDNFPHRRPGTIDGSGFKFWTEFWENVAAAEAEGRGEWTNIEGAAPASAVLWGCDGARVRGIRLINSAFWTSHCITVQQSHCRELLYLRTLQAVRALAAMQSTSTDAMVLTIRGCTLDTDDDRCIA